MPADAENKNRGKRGARVGDKRVGDKRDKGTKVVVYVALASNVLIALAKFGAGILTGSSSLLAEGAHSTGDTFNEVFLLISLSLSDNPPDEEHPFGHGKDRFFWSFLAAVFIFFASALFSFYEGYGKIFGSGKGDESFLPGYVVLGVSAVIEGSSLFVSTREVRRTAKEEGRSFRDELRLTRNTTVKLPVFEDSAALIGLLFAATGLVLTQLTGNRIFDGLGSIAIGVLLCILAWLIGTDSRDLLLDESMVPEDRERIRAAIESFPEVAGVNRLLTMHLGPNSALVTADVHVVNELTTDQIEGLIHNVNAAIQRATPEAKSARIFLELHAEPQASRRREATGHP